MHTNGVELVARRDADGSAHARAHRARVPLRRHVWGVTALGPGRRPARTSAATGPLRGRAADGERARWTTAWAVADPGLWPGAMRRAAGISTARRRTADALPVPRRAARREEVTG
jgi:hypothetical protein